MNFKKPIPPKSADTFLGWFCKGELLEEILGDLYEYHEELLERPNWQRKVIYWFHVLNFLRPNLVKKLSGAQQLNHYGMLKLTLKIASRSFLKQRLVSSMSLLSLIFGALCFHLIYVWVHNETSTDQFHENIDRIHVTTIKSNPNSDYFALSFSGFFNLDYKQFPHIISTLNMHTYGKNEMKLTANNIDYEGKALVVDSTFFDFFDFPLAQGNSERILDQPTNIVISQRFAQKIFGTSDPLGQMVDIKCDQTGTYQIAGVLEKIPSNSSMYFDFLIPRHSQNFWRRIPQEFFLTDDYFNAEDFNEQVAELGRTDTRFVESTLSTVPYGSIYFDHPIDLNLFQKYGDRNSITTMTVIAFVILLITLLGFTNLQTTLQLSDVKKIGLKQVVGASKSNLVMEIVISRLCYLLVSSLIALLIFHWIFPHYTAVMEVEIDKEPLFDLLSILTVTFIIIAISIVFAILQIYKIETKNALNNQLTFLKVPKMQRLITTVQYAVTIILLVATAVIFVQFRYMLNKDTGLNHTNVVSVDFFEIFSGSPESEERQKAMAQYEYVTNKMRQHPDILNVSQGDMPISSMAGSASWKVVGGSSDFASKNMISVDPGYAKLLGIELVSGRFFSDSLDQSRQQKVVINEAAKKYWDIENISDTKLITNTSRGAGDPFEVIGVVKDYHYEHLSNKIKPLILRFNPYEDENFLVRMRPGKEAACISFLETLFKEVNPYGIFTYEGLEEKVEEQYAKEKRVGKVYFAFTIVALFLSSIGLFTFALYETKRRTKEIGVRKINGASVKSVFSLLSFSFLKTILLAYIIACPIAWYLMNQWLNNFAYKAPIDGWIFVLVGLLAILIALSAISWQTWKVVIKNPVDTLRHE